MQAIKHIEKKVKKWKTDPIDFIKTFWPEDIIWNKLEEICYSVRDNKGTVVPSCHGAGKSYISAKIIIWWLFTRMPSKVITTAPTWNQVESILWGEIRASLNSAIFPLTDKKNILNTEIKLAPDWFARGISTNETIEIPRLS